MEYDWHTYIYNYGSEENCYYLGSDISSTNYDVAHVKLDGKWCLPSEEQIKELVENCDYNWINLNGVYGGQFTSKNNGKSIFLPAAGFCMLNEINYDGIYGEYWSSTQNPQTSYCAYYLFFDNDNRVKLNSSRYFGYTIRPVSTKPISIQNSNENNNYSFPPPPIKNREFGVDAENMVLDVVEQEPSFPGGKDALMSWLSRNIHYPNVAEENLSFSVICT